MYIEKKPCDEMNYYNEMKCFPSARIALYRLLQAYVQDDDYTILLPAYIGWSPNEGSGVYDPVCKMQMKHKFYFFTEELAIDIDQLKNLLKTIKGRKIILLVHYFGYIDPNYTELICLLREEDVFIIEDAAHALYTHLIDGMCGLGDCMIYSFHKMLPFRDGGAICTKNTTERWWNIIVPEKEEYPFYKYDLKLIAEKRKENASCWEKLLERNQKVELLRHTGDYKKQTPQTLPVLLSGADRFEVYQKMNGMGYGIISLYHTMIKPVADMNDAIINRISDNILNFPVHQDIGRKEILIMYDAFAEVIS